MGVVRDNNNRRKSLPSESHSDDHLLELNVNTPENHDDVRRVVDSTDIVDEILAQRESRRQEKKRLSRRCTPNKAAKPEATFRGLGCRGKSDKKHRRFENGNRLAHSLAIPGLDLDIDLHDDINIYDFVPNTVSAFAQLLMEKENMKAWNDFLAKTDEEQDEFLRQNSHLDDEWDNFDGEPGIQRQTGSGRKGSCHPAFSPELSFARIDKDLRNFLQEKRRLPFNMLEQMEEEVTKFFETDPMSIYKQCLSNSFERMLLRATAQYLNLACQNFNHKGGRWSRVENEYDFFSRPAKTLADFLEETRMQNQKEAQGRRWSSRS